MCVIAAAATGDGLNLVTKVRSAQEPRGLHLDPVET